MAVVAGWLAVSSRRRQRRHRQAGGVGQVRPVGWLVAREVADKVLGAAVIEVGSSGYS